MHLAVGALIDKSSNSRLSYNKQLSNFDLFLRCLILRQLDQPSTFNNIQFDEGTGALNLEVTTTKEDKDGIETLQVEKIWSL